MRQTFSGGVIIKLRKKLLTLFLGFCFYAAYGGALSTQIPNHIVAIEGEDISLRPFSPQLKDSTVAAADNIKTGRQFGSENTGSIKLCGIIPIKTVSVTTLPSSMVVPCGDIVGIKLDAKGIMVVSTDHFADEKGKQYSPALKSGIKPGDIITKVNGKDVSTGEELSSIVSGSKNALILTLLRNGEEKEIKITPYYDDSIKSSKLGLWVRDSCAGIGTLTFYNPETKEYAALGHPLSDGDTGVMYEAAGGKLTEASVISVSKGKRGVPGELCGIFAPDSTPVLGNIEKNSFHGINGKLFRNNSMAKKEYPIAPRSSIICGKASIISCIEGKETKSYEIEILKICSGSENSSKDMLIKVTDKELIEKTGGIVQGMSGSPIIQQGKLVGAVTHVLVNDPTRGYGIFIDKMLK